MTQLLSFGTGPDVLVLKISQDAWEGDARYTLAVDGVPFDGIAEARAAHTAGEADIVTLRGSFGPGRHIVTVDFLNDAYAGSPAADRNLYVEDITLNGQPVGGGTAVLFQAGSREFGFTGGPPPAKPAIGSGPDVFRLSVGQDSYRLDDAAFTVTACSGRPGTTASTGAAAATRSVAVMAMTRSTAAPRTTASMERRVTTSSAPQAGTTSWMAARATTP